MNAKCGTSVVVFRSMSSIEAQYRRTSKIEERDRVGQMKFADGPTGRASCAAQIPANAHVATNGLGNKAFFHLPPIEVGA